mmetsp:Transcript_29395/g.68850  ORF Transcript_29395/g.68850 Transcript_29395/m.68850 type:complete len:270 (-) Transcript_29395:72-881(-)
MTRADSPMYLSTMADATTLRKVPLMLEARARARRVLPVPGGPYRRTPLGALIPTRTNSSGLVSGSSMTSRSSRICSLRPPMSAKEAPLPGSSSELCMWKTVGSTSRGRMRMMVSVVMSSATRTPGLSLSRFSRVRHPTTYRGPLDALTMYRSESRRLRTSPMIWPTDWRACRSSSVFWYRATRPLTSSRIRLRRASTSRCSRILARYWSRTWSRSDCCGGAGAAAAAAAAAGAGAAAAPESPPAASESAGAAAAGAGASSDMMRIRGYK